VVEVELHRHRGTAPKTVVLETVRLRFAAGNDWHEAEWEFSSGSVITRLPADEIDEFSTRSDRFDMEIIDGNGKRFGPFPIEAMLRGYPSNSLCFLFCADEQGVWSGHTVSRSFGQVVVVPHRFDPS
jgi:hypothetical protein